LVAVSVVRVGPISVVTAAALAAVVPVMLVSTDLCAGVAASANTFTLLITFGVATSLEVLQSGESNGILVGSWVFARRTTASSFAKSRRWAPKATPSKGAKIAVPAVAIVVVEGPALVEFLGLAVVLLFTSGIALRTQSSRMEEPVTPPLAALGAYLISNSRANP
jgi:hypothetical protein